MSEELNLVYKTIDEQHSNESAVTRRKLVAGAAAGLGAMGLLAAPNFATAAAPAGANDPQTILNIAATAEVLATIVNTVGFETVQISNPVTKRNIRAAAREELIHYDTLVAAGAVAVTKKIWVPDVVFSRRVKLLETLEVGDQIFVNAYLVATKTFGNAGNGALALTAAEFMGVEAVHRALARQALGKLGNDRVFMRYDQPEGAKDSPVAGQPGFEDVTVAVAQLQAAGFGFGAKGAGPGRFYDFDEVRKRTPTDPDLNTFNADTD